MDLTKNRQSGKQDARQPDIVTAELKKGFEWTTSHTRLVSIIVGVFIAIGLGLSGFKYFSEGKEKDLQTEYFQFEQQISQKKEAFEEAKNPKPPVKAEEEEIKKVAPVKATGDLAKDYGEIPTNLDKFVSKNSKSRAGAMAALNLSGILVEYKKPQEAIEVLKKVKVSGVLGDLISMQQATVLANLNKCNEASPMFEQLVASKTATYLKLEAKMKLGLCQSSLGNAPKAEETLAQVVEEGKDNAIAKSAQKYLRAIQLKKNIEGKPN